MNPHNADMVIDGIRIDIVRRPDRSWIAFGDTEELAEAGTRDEVIHILKSKISGGWRPSGIYEVRGADIPAKKKARRL